jgi:toxin-antitoxin system PIN domain toxin
MPDRTALLDVNVLLALYDGRHVHHDAAHRWFAQAGTFATTPLTETSFVRLVSNPKVGGESVATALAGLAAIRALDRHVFIPDGTSLDLPEINLAAVVGYRQVTDAHLVSLAAAHGCVVATFDAKIARALAEPDRRHVQTVPV